MTTKEVGILLSFPASEIAKLCREGKIYAEKVKNEGENFPSWYISRASFVRFLQYNYVYYCVFKKQEESDMRNVISALLDKAVSADKRMFTIGEVETILGLQRMKIYKLCWKGKLGHRFIPRNFTLFDILTYIRHTPNEAKKLQDRYEDALVNGKPTLMLLREIVTAYAYFKEKGYII